MLRSPCLQREVASIPLGTWKSPEGRESDVWGQEQGGPGRQAQARAWAEGQRWEAVGLSSRRTKDGFRVSAAKVVESSHGLTVRGGSRDCFSISLLASLSVFMGRRLRGSLAEAAASARHCPPTSRTLASVAL